MRLVSLTIRDFRNLASVDIDPSPRTTVLAGDNGHGKTNLLEAIYFLVTLRPLRAGRLKDLVRFGQERALVAGDIETAAGRRRAAVEVSGGVRTALLDSKPAARLDRYFDGVTAVSFTPDDLLLVKGGPERRRRFIDRAAFNRWPAVLTEAREFLRALRERNAALRASPPDVEASFREPLARAGARLLMRRRALVEELAPRLAAAFAQISGPAAPSVDAAYRPASAMAIEGDEDAVATRLDRILLERLDRDREAGFTSAGPHMDDLVLSVGDRSARLYASQGQQRALVLALKIAEIENLRATLGRPPLLLLDDVSSELDAPKNAYLTRYLADLPAQVFLSTTDERLLGAAATAGSAFFRVESGVVRPLFS